MGSCCETTLVNALQIQHKSAYIKPTMALPEAMLPTSPVPLSCLSFSLFLHFWGEEGKQHLILSRMEWLFHSISTFDILDFKQEKKIKNPMIIPLHSRDGDGISINSTASRWWWYGVDISWNREYIEFILVIHEPC
jgi:hypothetical protein